MKTRSSQFPLYVMLIMKITLEVQKYDRMQKEQSSPSYRALNVKL
jgi:hypothetical protein